MGVEDSERRTDVRGRREGEWPRASPMLGNLTAAPVGSREPVPRFALVCCLPPGAARKRGGWIGVGVADCGSPLCGRGRAQAWWLNLGWLVAVLVLRSGWTAVGLRDG